MVTKKSLAKELNKQFRGDIDHKMASEVIDFVFDKINDHLYASKKIKITNFMTLYLDPVPSREFFNPKTERWDILPNRWKLVTKISPTLNEKIKQKPCYLPPSETS